MNILDFLQADYAQLKKHIEWQSKKAGGPGGQKINKSRSAIQIKLPALDLQVDCQTYRSLDENRKSAIRLLKKQMALKNRERPSEEVMQKLRPYFNNGLHIKDNNELLPLLWAVLMAAFSQFEGNDKSVAEHFGLSRSRLNKYIAANKQLLNAIKQFPTYAKWFDKTH